MTFFVLGEVIEQMFQALEQSGIKDLSKIEIGYHSWDHRSLWDTNSVDFVEKAKLFKDLVKQRTGKDVIGFRAPSWSISPDVVKWLYPALKDLGFKYSSSEFRFSNFLYKPVFGTEVIDRFEPIPGFWEYPVNPAKVLGVQIPYNGGIYARFCQCL